MAHSRVDGLKTLHCTVCKRRIHVIVPMADAAGIPDDSPYLRFLMRHRGHRVERLEPIRLVKKRQS